MDTELPGPGRTGVRVSVAGLLAVLALTAATVPAASAAAQADDDPELDQSVDPDQRIVRGEHTLDIGHVDLGPTFDDGQWRFLIHDDLARDDAGAHSVWRYPEETALHVVDEAQLTVPDDPLYEFLGAAPGEQVWVVPQTQHRDVVWLGWNTQDPEVMRTIDRGVTLSLAGVQGPGTVTVYLQSGSFSEPQVLWDSRIPDIQPIWVDVNTHTHANWVFTEPGVYLLALIAEADLVDGSTVTDTRYLRLAVGTDTAPADALAATWDGPDIGAAGADPDRAAAADDSTSDRNLLVPVAIGLLALTALGLAVALVVVVVRGNRARQRVLADRGADGGPDA